ncbi:energy transducer TonB [Polaribacter aquimarinus]|nr:energy transducer TonB [Polaribacter aquimarinus]
MKSSVLVFILFFTVFTFFSQDKNELAAVYLKRAQKSYSSNNFEKSERYLEKAKVYFESIKTKEMAIFGSKIYFENGKYVKAKEYLTAFFKLNKDKNNKVYNDMLLLYTDTLDAIENPDLYKKKKRMISPKVISEDKNVIKVDGDSEKTNENTDKEEIDNGSNAIVSFAVIENVPVFPGCKGGNLELKECFNNMVQVHFSSYFDADLPNTLGLTRGKKKVFIGFLIDKEGVVKSILVRAPHPLLEKEVIRVMSLLPKMKPGTQRGKNVGVKYSIPFTLIVD